jgi:hypothetical protein
MAGDDGSRVTGPFPQTGQASGAGSVNFWIFSKRWLHFPH